MVVVFQTLRGRKSGPRPLLWGYGHYAIFAAVAALGAGLQVVVDTTGHTSHVSPVFAAFTVAIPVAIFLVVLGTLNSYLDRREPPALRLTALRLVLATAVLVLATALTARVLPLPVTMLIMAVLVTLSLAYYLTAAHRTGPPITYVQPQRQRHPSHLRIPC